MPELPDTEPLLTLLALAEAGSESAAAEALGIGQSSVSRRLASLQRASSEPLTQRTATGSKLTPAGERLLPHAREVRAALTAASRLLASDVAGPLALRFGLTPELAPRFAGPLAAGAADMLEPRFVEASSHQLLAAVRSGELHGALTTWAPAGREPGFVGERVAGDRIDVIAPPGRTLFADAELDPGAFRQRVLLLPPADSGVGLRAAAALRASGLEPRSVVSLGSQSAVVAATVAGAGVGVVLASACNAEVTAGWLSSVALPGAGPLVDVWLIIADDLSARDAAEVRALAEAAVAAAGGVDEAGGAGGADGADGAGGAAGVGGPSAASGPSRTAEVGGDA